MVKTAMNRFGWRLPFLAAAMLVFAASLALFGGETRAVIAAVVFDDTQPLLETADAPTLLSDVLGVSEQRREPPGHTSAGDAHGSIGHYKIQLATDPNYVGDTTTNAVKVEITVDDVTIDGMQYNVATSGSIAAGTAHRIVELCAKGAAANQGPDEICGASDSGWGDTVTLYFASDATGNASGVGIWNVGQTVSVKAVDDNIADVRPSKTVRINHAFTNYTPSPVSNSDRPAKIRVTVGDNDDRGVLGNSIADSGTIAVPENNGTTATRFPIKLRSRPQLGNVRIAMQSYSQDGSDFGNPADDLLWRLDSGATCPASTGSNYFDETTANFLQSTAGKSITFGNVGSNLWNVDQSLCLLGVDDSIALTESISMTLVTSNATATKTDYDAGFVVGVPVTGTGATEWTPAYPTVLADDAAGAKTFTLSVTLTDDDAANRGITFTHDPDSDSNTDNDATLPAAGITLNESP